MTPFIFLYIWNLYFCNSILFLTLSFYVSWYHSVLCFDHNAVMYWSEFNICLKVYQPGAIISKSFRFLFIVATFYTSHCWCLFDTSPLPPHYFHFNYKYVCLFNISLLSLTNSLTLYPLRPPILWGWLLSWVNIKHHQ